MAENVRRTKRVVVRQRVVVPLAMVAGAVAYWSPASPTGSKTIDAAIIVLGTAALTWIGAAASWWVHIVASGAALASSGRLDLAVAGLVALGFALRIGMHQRNHSVLRTLAAGIAFNVLLRAELDVFAGLSSAIGLTIAMLVYISGTRRRTEEQQRWIHGSTIILFIYALAAGSIMSASAFAARSNLVDAIGNLRNGMNQLSSGEIDQAAVTLGSASRQLDLARDRINAFWTQPARAVPVFAQHRRAVDDLSTDAAQLVNVIVTELDQLELDSLTPVNGTFDLSSIDSTARSVFNLREAITKIDDTVADTRSMWLIAPIQSRIDELSREVTKQRTQIEDVDAALSALPQLLGSDEPRRYFVAFTTPAEARGSGGFMGSWAELSADQGRLTLERLGRTNELNVAGTRSRQVTGPEDFLATWGNYGFTSGPSGSTERDVWSNITVSAHFPSTGQVMAELYPQSGGKPVDGVFALDIEALSAFLNFTGPVTIPGVETPLGAENAVEFLLFDQYRLADDVNRVDVLESFSRAVVDALLGGAIPGPRELVEGLAPVVRENRIMGYATRPAEQKLFERLSLSGALPTPADNEAIGVSFNNASASKLELFLDAALDYSFSVTSAGDLRGEFDLALTNSAPSTGWPEGVIGNYVDLPAGTNRLMVTIYSRFAPTSATFGEEELEPVVSLEAGYIATSYFVVLEPGDTQTLQLVFEGRLGIPTLDGSEIPIVLRTPAMVRPLPVTVRYTNQSGRLYQFATDDPGIFLTPRGSENLSGE